MIAVRSEYQGKPMIQVKQNEEDEYAIVNFGVRKALCLLHVIPELVAFVTEHGGDNGKKAVQKFYEQYSPIGGRPSAATEQPKPKAKKAPKTPVQA